MNFFKKNIFSFLTLIALIIISFYFYPTLPESIPTRFDLSGNPIQYSSKDIFVFMMPSIYVLLFFSTFLMIRMSPHKFSMPNSRKAIDTIMAGSGFLFIGIHLGLMLEPSGKGLFIQVLSIGMALFLIVVGNVMGKTERNFSIGIRVPWTINSEANWKATHRLGGKMMVASGLILLVLSFFYAHILSILFFTLTPVLISVFYSYLYYRKNEIH